FIGALVGIAIAVMYLLTLQNLLKQISPENRKVEPSNVWLMLIPIFNWFYPFFLYPNISDSIKNEYLKRGLSADGNFARSIGVAMPVLGLCAFIPVIGAFCSLANFILWIIYWIKMADYKNKLN
ncbi:MAG: hypothetical protein ACKO8Q_03965, partial [Bacteroidota bacterium]